MKDDAIKVSFSDISQDLAVKVIRLRDDPSVVHGPRMMKTDSARSRSEAAVREAELWAAVGSHRNVLALHETFFEDSLCYLVMERCELGLGAALERSPHVDESLLGVAFAHALQALAHVHAAGVVHRDVKPDNFLCSKSKGGKQSLGVVKLCDFGLATHKRPSSFLRRQAGTPPFMAPEMLNERGYDEKVDVWSLGSMLYVMLFGDFPYKSMDRSAQGMKMATRLGMPPPSYEHEPDHLMRLGLRSGPPISAEAKAFAGALLCRVPTHRPSAAEALQLPFVTAPVVTKGADGSCDSSPVLPSLRSILHLAWKVGAFTHVEPLQGL